jgi:hypothetical protein
MERMATVKRESERLSFEEMDGTDLWNGLPAEVRFSRYGGSATKYVASHTWSNRQMTGRGVDLHCDPTSAIEAVLPANE